jgi:hypothetical protein
MWLYVLPASQFMYCQFRQTHIKAFKITRGCVHLLVASQWNSGGCVRYRVLITENIKITVFGNVALCSLVLMYLNTWHHIPQDCSELHVDSNNYVTYCHILGVWEYRQGMNWILDLLTTCICHSKPHSTDHRHTQTSVLSLLQSPQAVSWQQLIPREILQLPTFWSSCLSFLCRTLVNWQLS